MKDRAAIALVGDYAPGIRAHAAIPVALHLAADELDCEVEPVWIGTEAIGEGAGTTLNRFHGVWCVPNSPYRSQDGALHAIRFARENRRPFLGTCGGFQHALLEVFRNVVGLADAEHLESAPDAAVPVISRLECSLANARGVVAFPNGSTLAKLYGRPEAVEEYHCNFGLNPRFEPLLGQGGLRVAATDESGAVRAVELPGHPCFFATLFQPERSAFKGAAHPLIAAFLKAARESTHAPGNQPPSE
ncbi:MAG: CTP synthase C-terminal region-related (seleno)protein [Limisphaerales bacterium]